MEGVACYKVQGLHVLNIMMRPLFLSDEDQTGRVGASIRRNSIHHGRRVSRFSVVPDRLETVQANQRFFEWCVRTIWLAFFYLVGLSRKGRLISDLGVEHDTGFFSDIVYRQYLVPF